MNVFLAFRKELNRVLGTEVPSASPLEMARSFIDILKDMPDFEAAQEKRAANGSPRRAWEIAKCREHGYAKSLKTLIEDE